MLAIHPAVLYFVAIVWGVVILLASLFVFAFLGSSGMIVAGVVLLFALYVMYRLKHVAEERQRDAMAEAGEE